MEDKKESRVVFNYRRALREPKKIRQITDNYYLPFSIELIPLVNFIVFIVITFALGWMIRQIYPYAFSNTWFIFLVGIPLALTWLVTKIKPEGKNIYIFIYDYVKYVLAIKIPRKKYCDGEEVKWANQKKVLFKDCVWVVNKKDGKIKTGNKDNKGQFVINENGRRVRVLSDKERINSDTE